MQFTSPKDTLPKNTLPKDTPPKDTSSKDFSRREHSPEARKSFRRAMAAAAVVLAAAILLLFYFAFRPSAQAGAKHISLEVVDASGGSAFWEADTDASYLEQAMEEMDGLSFSGSRTEAFGLMVLTINDITADPQTDGAYWALYLEDTPCSYGVSSQPLEDGQNYRFVYERFGDWDGES